MRLAKFVMHEEVFPYHPIFGGILIFHEKKLNL